MSVSEFIAEFRRMASQNHVLFVNENKLTTLLQQEIARGDSFVNVFHGTNKQLLMMTSGAVAAFKNATFGIKLLWKIDVAEVEAARPTRRVFRGYIIDELDIYLRSSRTITFRFGFTGEYEYARAEIAEGNADTAAEQLENILGSPADADSGPVSNAGNGPQFDPAGPEQSGARARAAASNDDWDQAFTAYVRAVDQLHDFYVYENFRNRQPGPQDAWLVDGLVESLHHLKRRHPDAQVAAGVREATHRLRTIATNCDHAGGNSNLYRNGLQGLASEAPEVDVRDIFW